MTNKPMVTALFASGIAPFGALIVPASVLAGGCGTPVYHDCHGGARYTTGAAVRYAPTPVYLPADDPADRVYAQVVPTTYRTIYRQSVYTQPLCVSPTHTPPVYDEVVYIDPAPRVRAHIRIGGHHGHSKTVHHRTAYHHRTVHRSHKRVHRTVHVSRRPTAHVRHYPRHVSHHRHHPPRHVSRHRGSHRGHHDHHRPQRSGTGFRLEHRH